ncbi:MAG: trypsin-like peptidase domain-containing protein [Rhodocyclaceae bacterium]
MKRVALYSSSRAALPQAATAAQPAPVAADAASSVPTVPPAKRGRLLSWLSRHPRASAGLALLLCGGLGFVLALFVQPAPWRVTQGDIDKAVRQTLEKHPLPSRAAKAYEAVSASVVRVYGYGQAEEEKPARKAGEKAKKDAAKGKAGEDKSSDEREEGTAIGTGVVITEQGAILTNLHVVSGTTRIKVLFADGTESEALVVGLDPRNDLAVLRASTLPDDLKPATLASTRDLRPGDEVIAVGFPFGFGPSTSSGVVSGLKREFRSPTGNVLSNLIQFDAAANPGNSGGPLVTMDGAVVGIVTAILNPVDQRFFVGLGFAVPIENAAAAVGIPPF